MIQPYTYTMSVSYLKKKERNYFLSTKSSWISEDFGKEQFCRFGFVGLYTETRIKAVA